VATESDAGCAPRWAQQRPGASRSISHNSLAAAADGARMPHSPPESSGSAKTRRTLDPKLDVVFKLFFSRNPDLLISLLTAVLRPPVPIASVTLVNFALPKTAVDDKGGVLDVLVRLEDGRLVDVEMQCRTHPGLRQRALFYWARLYGSQGGPGELHQDRPPCVSIFILDFQELPGDRFHRIFRVLDVVDHEAFSDALELHTVELTKLPARGADPGELQLERWGRFLAAKTDDEREELAMSDPVMGKAKHALDILSAEPTAQELARQRELAQWTYEFEMATARKEGRDEGRAEGEQALRLAVEGICDVLGIELDATRRGRLDGMTLDELQRLHEALRTGRRWPDE
jgi:predicted transposase/invertase (TIGR01784 family)